jgi:hypothetical protein
LKKNTSDNLALARRIRAAGVAIHIAEDDEKGSCMPSDGLIVRQLGGLPDSTAFEFEGGTGYIIDLAITVNLPIIAIADFDLELPWEKISFRWLQDPLELGDFSTPYRFTGKNSLAYERGQVINHFADVRQTLRQGQSISGLLLGISNDPITDEFKTGTLVPATVVISDQFLRKYRADVRLFINKQEKHRREGSSIIYRRGGLFEKPDFIGPPTD